jgi:hypothetical protein
VIGDIAKSYIGTPFRHQGRSPHFGLDCAGVLVCALEGAGVRVNDCRVYDRVPPRDLLQSMVELHGFTESTRPPKTDDVCLFWMRNRRLVIHCGVVVEDGRSLIHVEAGRAVEAVPLRLWSEQLAATYTYKGKQTWQSS